MKWASVASDRESLVEAVEECVSSIRRDLGDTQPDLAVIFVSPHFANQYERIPPVIRDKLGPTLLFGCSAGGVIGGGHEIERRPGFSLTVAQLPDVKLRTFHLQSGDLPDLDSGPDEWEKTLNVSAKNDPDFLLVLDPFSFPAENFLLGMDYGFSRSVKVGGLASGGNRQGENALFLGDVVHQSGAIGIAMEGNVAIDPIVAQGCRPVGQVMCITRSQHNMLQELDQKPPLEVLKDLFSSSTERDQELMQSSLFLGIVMDDFIEDPKQGDFLVRNVVGLDSRTGIMAIGENLREGQRVQFHLRDALTSADDLAAALGRYTDENKDGQSQGALLFSCLGRGEYLYGRPDHDTDMFKDKLGVPLGGFFCNGEIGPVGGSTFLHGYTSSFGIFRPASDS